MWKEKRKCKILNKIMFIYIFCLKIHQLFLSYFYTVRFLLFLKRLNMSSQIANLLCATVQNYNSYKTIITTITTCLLFLSAYNLFASNTCSYSSHTIIRYSAHNLFVSTNLYLIDLYSEELQTTTGASHKGDCDMISQTNVLL